MLKVLIAEQNCGTGFLQAPKQHTRLSWAPSLVSRLLFLWISAVSISAHASDKLSPSCWVEVRSPIPFEELMRSGVTFKPAQDLDTYAILKNPSVPDYRSGFTADKRPVTQFMATCEDSKEAISVLIDDTMRQKMAAYGISVIVRPATQRDVDSATFVVERPKYWLRDCTVAIKYFPAIKKKDQDSWELPSFLREFTINRQDVFALNNVHFDFAHARVYIDFWRSCDRRIEMATTFITAYQKKYDDGRHYRVMKRKFDPFHLRSRSGGSMWLDHFFPDGPPRK